MNDYLFQAMNHNLLKYYNINSQYADAEAEEEKATDDEIIGESA